MSERGQEGTGRTGFGAAPLGVRIEQKRKKKRARTRSPLTSPDPGIPLSPLSPSLSWLAITRFDASPVAFWAWASKAGVKGVLAAWPSPWDPTAWSILAGFGAFQAALQLGLPGKRVTGPVTPAGNTPVYTANGVPAYLVTMATLAAGHWGGWLDLAVAYDKFGEILAALNVFSLALCAGLWAKGHLAPSSTDSGSTGSLLYDFYWGMELYPRIGTVFDIKTWTNCRMGMAGWASLCWAFAAANGRDGGSGAPTDAALVTATLINVYLFKFFVWEPGYWASMDIAHDRAGYYICWGCLVWVPSVYASPALFLGAHPGLTLGTPRAVALIIAGLAAIWINYDADRQRQAFRATGGKEAVWGRAPVKIVATYTDGRGATRRSLLLASGWWGLARHFHYVPEIAVAALWTAPCGSPLAAPLAWFYVFFLTVRNDETGEKKEERGAWAARLAPRAFFFSHPSPPPFFFGSQILLFDRAFRDDARCAAKYGAHWDQYRKLVPYKVVPGLF